ncbi:hypothetical protein H8356DRAFT_1065721, partial [Neocallimastix lanati (nom. inval.)]
MLGISNNSNNNSNNEYSEKTYVGDIKKNNILSPPSLSVSYNDIKDTDNNPNITEEDVKATQSEMNQPISEELVDNLINDKPIEATKINDLDKANNNNDDKIHIKSTESNETLKINDNLESPVKTVEKIIISPPTTNDVTEEASHPNIKGEPQNQENNEIINQDLLMVSPVLEGAKPLSNSEPLNEKSQLKENPNIIKSFSIKSN